MRWKRHQALTKLLHMAGIHDYMPTIVYDNETDSVSAPQLVCRICHHEMGS